VQLMQILYLRYENKTSLFMAQGVKRKDGCADYLLGSHHRKTILPLQPGFAVAAEYWNEEGSARSKRTYNGVILRCTFKTIKEKDESKGWALMNWKKMDSSEDCEYHRTQKAP